MSSVCLVCGSRRATSPALRSRKDTSRIGTAQFVSTSLPKTMFPVMAATRPTPVKKPRAEELEGRKEKRYNSGKFICCNRHPPQNVFCLDMFFFPINNDKRLPHRGLGRKTYKCLKMGHLDNVPTTLSRFQVSVP